MVPLHADSGGVPIGGTLWVPEGDAPRGLVLMYPGSGPSDRDNDVLFPPIRAAVLARNVAVCSFDKRGVGESGGHWMQAGIATQAQDLLAGLEVAKSALAELGHRATAGLFGHSQGGWVVLEAAVGEDIRFVITNSGPAVTPAEQELYSTRTRLTRAGWAATDIEAAVALLGEVFALAAAGHPFDEAAALLKASGALGTRMTRQSVFVPDNPKLWAFARSIVDHDPRPALEALRVPLLALLGECDAVVPVARSASVFRSAVDPHLLDLQMVKGGDHRMQRPNSDEFVPGYLDAVADFVAAQFDGPTVPSSDPA
jgi:pimeloyl-ACP methyl ester carboxylesterase